jgi:hypothetical protein
MGDSTAMRRGQCANFFRASTTATPAGVMADATANQLPGLVPGELAAAFINRPSASKNAYRLLLRT